MLVKRKLSPACLIGRQYKIVRLLGQGAAGTVYEVERLDGGARYALKVFTPSKGDLLLLKKKFLAEAKVLTKLDHPNIVKVYDSGIDEETRQPFFVMDEVVYKDGLPHTLDDVETGDLDEGYVRMWFEELAAALDYIHETGVVHRDIKCGNILLRPDKHVVLSDFGISKIFSGSLTRELQITRTVPTCTKDGTTKTKFLMGTAGYMAPEVVRGRPASDKSDVYSLGVVLFRMLTGLWYEPGSDVAEILEMYEYRWDKVLLPMLAEAPETRPSRLCGLVRFLERQDEEEQ